MAIEPDTSGGSGRVSTRIPSRPASSVGSTGRGRSLSGDVHQLLRSLAASCSASRTVLPIPRRLRDATGYTLRYVDGVVNRPLSVALFVSAHVPTCGLSVEKMEKAVGNL